MLQRIFRRTVSSTSSPKALPPSLSHVGQEHRRRVQEAINMTLPILNMRREEAEAELRALEKEMGTCRMDPEVEDFVKRSLRDFRPNMIKSVATGEEKINEMTRYILNTPSKLFRPSISLMVHRILRPHDENLEALTELCKSYELVHIGSLIHDDILDESEMRRKVETLHTKVGVKLSVLIGDFLLSKSARIVSKLDSIQLVHKLSDTLEDLITGEMQSVNLNDNMCENYLGKVYLKTASLISNNISSIPILYRMDGELNDLLYLIGVHIGIGFQICDDLLDYNSNVNNLGKPPLKDLKSGLITLPLIHTMHGSGSSEVAALLDARDFEGILAIMNASGEYITKCKLAIHYHLHQVRTLLSQLGPGPCESLVSYIHRVISRP